MSRPPAGGNAVGHRTGYLNLFTSAYPSTYPSAAAQQQLHTDLSRWSEGGSLLNFLSGHPITPAEIRAAYTDEAYRRLVDLKNYWDRDNVFRFNHNIIPDL